MDAGRHTATGTLRRGRFAAAAVLSVALLAAPAGAATPKQPLTLGTADPGYLTLDDERREQLFDKTITVGAKVVRLNAFWFRIGKDPELEASPEAQRDPANPLYDFAALDAAVREADSRDLDVIITIQRAPRWAEGENRPQAAHDGVWKPDPAAFGRFSQAVAERYSGAFTPSSGPTLPRARYYQAWNEPNLRNHLLPQYDDVTGEAVSVEAYRELLAEAVDGIRAADAIRRPGGPASTIVVAGTSPVESVPPSEGVEGTRVGPERFWRELLCLDPALQPIPPSDCPRAEFDVFDHHPITQQDPRIPGPGDSVWIADYPDLTRILRAAEAADTVLPLDRTRPLWATEIYWKTNPPSNRNSGVPLGTAASYLQRGIRMLYDHGVTLQINFFLADLPKLSTIAYRPGGLLYNDLRPKPSFTAFRFPFVADRIGRKTVSAWGRSPSTGRLRIQRRAGGRWKLVKEVPVRRGAVFRVRLRLTGRAPLRAKVGGDMSLVYRYPTE